MFELSTVYCLQELPSGVRAKCTAAHKQNNKNKNRFVNIITCELKILQGPMCHVGWGGWVGG